MIMIRTNDQPELQKRKLTPGDLEQQVARLNRGTIPLNLIRPCHLGDGITQLSEKDFSTYRRAWDEVVAQGRTSKFIPASGAATRLFQPLLQYLADPDHSSDLVRELGPSLPQYPFYQALAQTLRQQGHQMDELRKRQNFTLILKALLHPDGLDYAHLPKALLPFHCYPEEIRTALEEHIHDSVRLKRDSHGKIRCHITVSPR